MKRFIAATILALGTVNANACAVCFQNNHARTAYLATTAALILLPATLVGTVALVIRRRMKIAETEAAEEMRLNATSPGRPI
jgi:hypothetical protein